MFDPADFRSRKEAEFGAKQTLDRIIDGEVTHPLQRDNACVYEQPTCQPDLVTCCCLIAEDPLNDTREDLRHIGRSRQAPDVFKALGSA
jgi:hypothetical protein